MQGSRQVGAGRGLADASIWGFGVLVIASACAQPSQEKRPGFARPPPPILKDGGFVAPDEEDEDELDEDAGDGPPYDDEEESDSGSQELPDSGSGTQPDAQVPPRDAGPIACTQTTCGSSCVDLNTNSQHCGTCNHQCPGNAACNAGTCASPDNDCTYQLREGHDYLFCNTQSTWDEARERCKEFGLDLVIVADENENNFVKGSEPRWIGLRNTRKNPFRWIVPGGGNDGAAISYAPWAKNEPNDDDSCLIPIPGFPLVCEYEDCAEVLAAGTWNDGFCDKNDTKNPYVCESY